MKYETSIPLVGASISLHKTFMDSLGRTSLTLTAMNVVDESRDKDLIVSGQLLIFGITRARLRANREKLGHV